MSLACIATDRNLVRQALHFPSSLFSHNIVCPKASDPHHVHFLTPLLPLQSLQILDFSEVEKEFELYPHDIRFSSSLMLDTRSLHVPAEFTDHLLQVMTKLFPEQRVWLSSENNCRISIEGRDVYVEVTSFEPMQEILVNWNLQVSG